MVLSHLGTRPFANFEFFVLANPTSAKLPTSGRQWRMIGSSNENIRKNTARNPAKIGFFRFLTFSVRFDPFLTSWRPGTRLKSFLEAIRFFSTVYEPVATLKTSNRLNFYDFSSPITRPIFPKPAFFEKVDLIFDPSPIHKDENDRKWIL